MTIIGCGIVGNVTDIHYLTSNPQTSYLATPIRRPFMLKKIIQVSLRDATKVYLNVINSIAFYPTLIAIALFFLSLFTLYLDEVSPGLLFGYELDVENIIYPDSARTLLGAIVGGMISLMVFSFSMVMLILSQISSNYSPRLLPNLVGQRSKQVAMGFYIGTIVYTFVILTSIQSKFYAFGVPSLSIVISCLLSLFCLALFVSFINNVSQDIQIGNIVNHVYQDTMRSLRHEIETETYVSEHTLPNTEEWTVIHSPVSGYINEIRRNYLLRATRRLDVVLKMKIPVGQFVNRRDELLLASRSLSKEEQEELINSFVFRHQEEASRQHIYGFKHLTEVALKALSPGINDPGTAIQAIDRLTDLLVEFLSLRGSHILTDQDDNLRLIHESIRYDDVLYLIVSAISEYGQSDLTVMVKLLIMLQTILQNDTQHQHTDVVMNQLNELIASFEDNFKKPSDRKILAQRVDTIIKKHAKPSQITSIRARLGTFLSSDAA